MNIIEKRIEERKRNEGKMNCSPNNIRLLVNQAIDNDLDIYKHILANIQIWSAPENMNDKQASNWSRVMGGISFAQIDKIIKEETQK